MSLRRLRERDDPLRVVRLGHHCGLPALDRRPAERIAHRDSGVRRPDHDRVVTGAIEEVLCDVAKVCNLRWGLLKHHEPGLPHVVGRCLRQRVAHCGFERYVDGVVRPKGDPILLELGFQTRHVNVYWNHVVPFRSHSPSLRSVIGSPSRYALRSSNTQPETYHAFGGKQCGQSERGPPSPSLRLPRCCGYPGVFAPADEGIWVLGGVDKCALAQNITTVLLLWRRNRERSHVIIG